MFRGYFDGLIFLLIRSYSTKLEPIWNRSFNTFLKSTVTCVTGFNVKISHPDFKALSMRKLLFYSYILWIMLAEIFIRIHIRERPD